MPDILRLRYTGAHPALVPAVGREVEPDTIVDLPGKLLTQYTPDGAKDPVQVPEDADYFLIESGVPPQVHAWPKSLWANETPAKKVKE